MLFFVQTISRSRSI